MNLIYLFVVAWFLLTVLASNLGKQKGYTGWPFFIVSLVGTVLVLLLSAKKGGLESTAPIVSWLLPLVLVIVALLIPARSK